MGKQTKDTVSLVDVLRTAKATDLQEITDAVAALETDLAALVADKSREIDSLKAAAKLLTIRLHGKPPRQPRGAKAAKAAKETGATGRESEDDADKLKCRIFDLIAQDGPQTRAGVPRRNLRSATHVAESDRRGVLGLRGQAPR